MITETLYRVSTIGILALALSSTDIRDKSTYDLRRRLRYLENSTFGAEKEAT